MSESPIRIYIGTDPSQLLGAKIFEYSVRRHTDAAVEFDTMMDVTWPFPKDPANQPGTNFSFNRFAIPKRAGYHGKALYVDADMLVLRDIRELWNTPFDGATVLCAPSSDPQKKRRQLSVLLLDCDRLTWDVDRIITEDLDSGKYTYDQLIYNLANEPEGALREGLLPEWNSLDKFEAGNTRLIHYTELKRQPWLSRKNRCGLVWVAYLADAIKDGVVKESEIEEAQKKGWARPSLLALLHTPRPLWPAFEKTVAPIMDRGFVPHEELQDRLNKGRKLAAMSK